MTTCYKFGIMLERIEDESPDLLDCPNLSYWRVFSARCHGPLMFTRRAAFFAWLKNWLSDFVRTKLNRRTG